MSPYEERERRLGRAVELSVWIILVGVLIVGSTWGCNAYKAHRIQALTGVQVTAMDVFLGVDQKVRVIREVAK